MQEIIVLFETVKLSKKGLQEALKLIPNIWK